MGLLSYQGGRVDLRPRLCQTAHVVCFDPLVRGRFGVRAADRSQPWQEVRDEKTVRSSGSCLSVFGRCTNASADPFHNLDFELATVGTPVDFHLPAATAMPYWTVGVGDLQATTVIYDTVSTGAPAVSLEDGLNLYGFAVMHPLQGSYSAILQSSGGPIFDAWIEQAGDVPANARSLLFESDNYNALGDQPLLVSLNGTPLSTSLYSVGGTVNSNWGPVKTYIADISAFSGQSNVTLRFDTPGPSGEMVDLDAIQFSSVPEPSALVLLAARLSLISYCWRRWNCAGCWLVQQCVP